MKTFYHLLALFLGYVVLVGAFIIWGDNLSKDVKILDIIISCVIYTVFAETTFFPMVNLKNNSHKEVGMIGLHYTSIFVYALVSIALMMVGIIYRLSLWPQLIGQLAALMVLLIGRTATLHSGEKTEQIYKAEKNIIQNKERLLTEMDNLIDTLRMNANIDPLTAEKIHAIAEEMRFVTPSNQPQTLMLNEELIGEIRVLSIMLKDYEANKEKISTELGLLGSILEKRRKY